MPPAIIRPKGDSRETTSARIPSPLIPLPWGYPLRRRTARKASGHRHKLLCLVSSDLSDVARQPQNWNSGVAFGMHLNGVAAIPGSFGRGHGWIPRSLAAVDRFLALRDFGAAHALRHDTVPANRRTHADSRLLISCTGIAPDTRHNPPRRTYVLYAHRQTGLPGADALPSPQDRSSSSRLRPTGTCDLSCQ